jgi:hypothetical protein
MNKLNICLQQQDAVSGYNNLPIENLNAIVNGTVDEILFIHGDMIEHNQRKNILIDLFKKLRNRGLLILVFLNIKSVAKQIYKTNISGSHISNLIGSKLSFMPENELEELVYSIKELSIINKYYDNEKIVVKITKDMTS